MAKDSLAKASTPEPFSTSRKSNWVARAGGLPDYIQHIAHDLMEKRGKSESNAIQMAIGIVKNWASGKGNVDANTRAAAAKAVREWESMKARNSAKKIKEAVLEAYAEGEHPRGRGGEWIKKQAKDFINGRVAAENLDPEVHAYVLKGLTHDLPIIKRMASGGGIVAGDAHERAKRQLAELRATKPKSAKSKRKSPLDEMVNFGGIPTRKGDVIRQLQAEGHPQAHIDRYLQGADRARKIKEAVMAGNVLTDEWPDEIDLGVFEAVDAEDKKDKGADESSEGQPQVYCPKDKKKVTPTKDGKCPTCGTDLSKAVAMAKKVQEAVLSAGDRKKLPSSAFAIPPDRYPIHDLSHARNALSRCAGKPEEGRVKAAVYKRYPQLKKSGD